MNCLILAGGLGTRLQAAVPNLPKCLAPVQGRPFLYWMIQMLHRKGIQKFTLSLGYQSEKIIAAVETFPSIWNIRLAVEPKPLGTGGAAMFALSSTALYDDFLLCNGDTWLDADISEMLTPLKSELGEEVRIGAVCVANVARYGGITTNGTRLASFTEKGAKGPGWINAGYYFLSPKIFKKYETGAAFSLEQTVLPRLLSDEKIFVHKFDGKFIDIGIPDDYYKFCELALHDK